MSISKREARDALVWLAEAGADEVVSEAPIDRFVSPPAGSGGAEFAARTHGGMNSQTAAPARRARPTAASPAGAVKKPEGRCAAVPSDSIGCATEIAAACNSLSELKAALESFDGCALKKFATRTVFADGTPEGRIMVIGESPGREEDLAGLPFVGRAGKLLDRMLAAIGLDRATNVYITNVVNWQPPGNRDPTPEEAAACLPFLRRHIELAAPELVVLLGAVAMRHVMGRNDGIMRLRGKWLEYHVGDRMVPVMPTLHPAYLLRRPIEKRLAWQDLQAILVRIKALGLLEPDAGRG